MPPRLTSTFLAASAICLGFSVIASIVFLSIAILIHLAIFWNEGNG